MIRRLAQLPPSLTSIAQPPKALFFDGDASLLERPKVAIVGTRRPSGYTKALTARFARELSASGAVILSGGAMGVDAIAHENSLPNTIAVLAGSLDVGFVQTNRKLIEQIRSHGLLLSEYESETAPKPWSFVHRNRLVTALADVVVVMEAAAKSGSMSSAAFALAQQKRLFVPPHRLGESEGTNGLLFEKKAQILDSVDSLTALLSLNRQAQTDDELITFCQNRPTYEETLERFGHRVSEYELLGYIRVVQGCVEVCHGAAGD